MIDTAVSQQGRAVPETAIGKLKDGLTNPIITPGAAEYETARKVFNGMIDRRPALIVQPTDPSEVQRCVLFAREHDLLLSIKGGGHSIQGFGVCEGGLMVDLGRMRAIHIDPATRTAVAEGGANWGEFDAASQQHGLAITGGRVPSTGIAGLTLGSGSGWLERKLGYTVDNLIGAEVVLANGELVIASEDENPDLFWALRGGGGNFGVVTKFRYRLHEVGPIIYGGMIGFRRDATVLRAYRDFMADAPDDVGGAAALITAPPAPFVPKEVQGQPCLGVVVCYTGNPSDGPQALKPILDLGPVFTALSPMPYVALQGLLADGYPHGLQNYWKAEIYPELPDEAIETLLHQATPPSSPLHSILVQPLGGQIHRVPDSATALGWRVSGNWALHVLGMWQNPEETPRHIEWVRALSNAMRPWAQSGAYLNYLMDEGDQRIRDSFGPNYARIAALKKKYDPTNLFRMNQNIKPAREGVGA